MKDTTIAITFDRYPFAFAALGMDNDQRDAYAARVQFTPDCSPRQALGLAAYVKRNTRPASLQR